MMLARIKQDRESRLLYCARSAMQEPSKLARGSNLRLIVSYVRLEHTKLDLEGGRQSNVHSAMSEHTRQDLE